MEVSFPPEARPEFLALPTGEQRAMAHAIEKLANDGDRLRFPHVSRVQGTASLFELRPRRGRSPWRAFYRRVGDAMVIGAVGPEAQVDPRGFARVVERAGRRLGQSEE